jgi:hypothetical protein
MRGEKKRKDADNSHLFIRYRIFRFPPISVCVGVSLFVYKIIVFGEVGNRRKV